MENINTVEYWDRKYEDMDNNNKNGIGCGQEDRRMWFQALFLNNNETIMEIGCGDATFYEFLKKQKFHLKKYIGTEISSYIIEKNKSKYPECEFIQTTTEIKPIESEIVDKIYCMHVIEHIEEPEKHIDEWMKSLKNKGIMVLSVPYEDNEYSEHLRIYTEDECEKLMSKITTPIQYEFFIRRLGWKFDDGRTAKELVMIIIKK